MRTICFVSRRSRFQRCKVGMSHEQSESSHASGEFNLLGGLDMTVEQNQPATSSGDTSTIDQRNGGSLASWPTAKHRCLFVRNRNHARFFLNVVNESNRLRALGSRLQGRLRLRVRRSENAEVVFKQSPEFRRSSMNKSLVGRIHEL